jgi:hypothetical protein
VHAGDAETGGEPAEQQRPDPVAAVADGEHAGADDGHGDERAGGDEPPQDGVVQVSHGPGRPGGCGRAKGIRFENG